MTYHTLRTPEQIRQDAARKLWQAQLGDDFLAILGCLLGEGWTQPRLVELRIASEGIALARPEDQEHFATCLGMPVDLLDSDGTLNAAAFEQDKIHLSQHAGYSIYSDKLKPVVEQLLKK